MGTLNRNNSSDEKRFTSELRDANRRFGVLIYKAVVGKITLEERAELEFLGAKVPEQVKKACG